jgi:hypothetical protein
MLLKAQNAIGELYLEIGMAQEGFKYFQKAWSNLLCFSLSDLKVSQELTKQKDMVDTCRGCHPVSQNPTPSGPSPSKGRGKQKYGLHQLGFYGWLLEEEG